MLKIRTLLPFLLTVLMPVSGARARQAAVEEIDEDQEDVGDDHEDPPEDAQPAPRRPRGRPARGIRISGAASSNRGQRRRPPEDAAAAPDAPDMQDRMRSMERQMQRLLQAVGEISSNRGQDPAADEDDDEDLVAGAHAPRESGRQPRSIPTSELLPHIPRQSLAWWDNHPAGTPIPYKDLPGQLRQAMDKNPRDRLEVQLNYTAMTLVASLLDALVAVTAEGYLQLAQFGVELILSHLFPLLARRVDALQQEGSLRSVFMSAQDPRSQYFIADPDTSYGILQKVASARVQALMTAAGRRENDDRRSTNRRNGAQRQGAGGSPQQPRARDRGTANGNGRNNNNASSGSSQRGGNSRDRGASRERRGSSRDGAASRSNPADSSSRGADNN